MKLLICNILLIVITILASDCNNMDEINEITVIFEYRLLNDNGQVSTDFSVGENFVFSFLIINNTQNYLSLIHEGLRDKNLFEVFKDENDKWISIGKPYELIFCNEISGIPINPYDTLKLQIPWFPTIPWEPGVDYYSSHFCIVNDQPPLLKGRYKTEFKSSFIFKSNGETIITDELKFIVQFNVN